MSGFIEPKKLGESEGGKEVKSEKVGRSRERQREKIIGYEPMEADNP